MACSLRLPIHFQKLQHGTHSWLCGSFFQKILISLYLLLFRCLLHLTSFFILHEKHFLGTPGPTLLECKGTVWDGNPATMLVSTGAMYHWVWIVSEQNVTRLAIKPSFLWRQIWLRCYHPWLSFLLGATVVGSNPAVRSFFQISSASHAPSFSIAISFFLFHEHHQETPQKPVR